MSECKNLLELLESKFVTMEERLPSTLAFFHVKTFLDYFSLCSKSNGFNLRDYSTEKKQYPQEKCNSRTMVVHVIWGNTKKSFALQIYSFEEHPIPFVWIDVAYCACTEHENWYFFFFWRGMETHFLRRNKMYQCRVLEDLIHMVIIQWGT